MESEYIDTRSSIEAYARTLARFLESNLISLRNKEILKAFLRDGTLGKTVIGKAKKKLGPGRLQGCIHHLTVLMLFLSKELDQVDQQDMERFILALETDSIRSRAPRIMGRQTLTTGAPLASSYKRDIKVTIKKFYKWLWGNNRAFPKLVEWIDTYDVPKEIQALTEAEIQRMIDRANKSVQRAMIQILFDGGFRIGELLNIRLHHVKLKQIDPSDMTKTCFFLRAPYSKTLPRTVALPMHETTKWLSLWLEDHPSRPTIQPDGNLQAENTATPLFPLTANAARKITNRLGTRALGKRVYPHLLRHSSATYWANKLPYFKFCKRFGWTMTSQMPQQYIDREGVDELETANIYYDKESPQPASDAYQPASVEPASQTDSGSNERATRTQTRARQTWTSGFVR